MFQISGFYFEEGPEALLKGMPGKSSLTKGKPGA